MNKLFLSYKIVFYYVLIGLACMYYVCAIEFFCVSHNKYMYVCQVLNFMTKMVIVSVNLKVFMLNEIIIKLPH